MDDMLRSSCRRVRREDLTVEFEYTSFPSRVVFGAGTTERSPLLRAIEALDPKRILIVAAEPEGELADRLTDSLGARVVGRFSRVRAHVPAEVAQEARAAAAAVQADSVLSVGGGSTTGTAKAIALHSGLPIIAVPTTYAGSEVTPVWGLTESGRKTTGVDPRVLPKLVIYDPRLTVSLPPRLSVVSGLNALAHCVEAFWTEKRNPITSLVAEEGIRALVSGLPGILTDPADLEARSHALYGAWLAGVSFATAGSGIHHKICHVLGGAYDLPHAETHAVILPYATAFAAPLVDGVDARITAALGAQATDAATAIHELARALSAPGSLRELGLPESELDRACDLVADALSALPEPPSRAASDALIRAAFAGQPLVYEL
jgi:alcohol dehydrogenase class IV